MLNFKQFFLQEKAIDFTIRPTNTRIQKLLLKFDMNKSMKKVGDGVESVAFFHETSQIIVKVLQFKSYMTEEQVKNEATYKYLQEITKEFNSGNPHFPKIYSVKFFNSHPKHIDDLVGDNHIYAFIKMERLRELDIDRDYEMVKGALYNSGFDFYDMAGMRLKGNTGEIIDTSKSEEDQLYDFFDAIEYYMHFGQQKQFIKKIYEKNPKFAKAMITIHNLRKKYNFDLDIHSGNIMIRVTSIGPQLVFTDPLLPNHL